MLIISCGGGGGGGGGAGGAILIQAGDVKIDGIIAANGGGGGGSARGGGGGGGVVVVVVGGSAVGETASLLSDGGLFPIALVAKTRNCTVPPGVNPTTSNAVPAGAVTSAQITPSVDDCRTYPVTTDPPSVLGAAHVTVAVVYEIDASGGAG